MKGKINDEGGRGRSKDYRQGKPDDEIHSATNKLRESMRRLAENREDRLQRGQGEEN